MDYENAHEPLVKLRLRKRDSKAETLLELHPDYGFADVVLAFDQAILEGKQVAVVDAYDETHYLDPKQYSAMALATET